MKRFRYKLTMGSHSMYSSATALQFPYQKKIQTKFCSSKTGRKKKLKQKKEGKFTHFISRMLPGEYWTNRVVMRPPHSTHLYSMARSGFPPLLLCLSLTRNTSSSSSVTKFGLLMMSVLCLRLSPSL